MIRELFSTVLDISVISGIFILVVAVLRTVLNRSPKWTRYFLWSLVGLRLICPVFLESRWSILPEKLFSVSEVIETDIADYSEKSQSSNGVVAISDNLSRNTDNTGTKVFDVLSVIWITGMLLLFTRLIVENIQISKKIQSAVRADRLKSDYGSREWMQNDNIYFLDGIRTSFTRGLFKPVIYIPTDTDPEDIESIIAHEKVHIRRKDIIWKQAGYVIASIHWFNPLVWLGYILFINDIEMACDEKVIMNMNEDDRKKYLLALIRSSENSNRLTLSTVAFGKMPIRRRLKEIMNIRKITVGATVVTLIAGIGVGAFFATRPVKGNDAPEQGSEVVYTEADGVPVPEEEWESLGILDNERIREDGAKVTSVLRFPDGSLTVTTLKEKSRNEVIDVPKEEWEALGVYDWEYPDRGDKEIYSVQKHVFTDENGEEHVNYTVKY